MFICCLPRYPSGEPIDIDPFACRSFAARLEVEGSIADGLSEEICANTVRAETGRHLRFSGTLWSRRLILLRAAYRGTILRFVRPSTALRLCDGLRFLCSLARSTYVAIETMMLLDTKGVLFPCSCVRVSAGCAA